MNIPQYIYSTEYIDLQRFMALLLQQMQSDLSDNGWQVPQLSNAEVAIVTGQTFQPIMRPGTMWFNTDLAKMQFITVQAVLNTSAATIETITSA